MGADRPAGGLWKPDSGTIDGTARTATSCVAMTVVMGANNFTPAGTVPVVAASRSPWCLHTGSDKRADVSSGSGEEAVCAARPWLS